MKLGKRTARLVREAAIMGFVHGAMWGRVQGRRQVRNDEEDQFPRDSDILLRVMRGARSNGDLYPLLSKADIEGVQVERTEEEWDLLRQLMGVQSPAVSSQQEKKEGETG